jgi:ketosteroid isomerase-like protein
VRVARPQVDLVFPVIGLFPPRVSGTVRRCRHSRRDARLAPVIDGRVSAGRFDPDRCPSAWDDSSAEPCMTDHDALARDTISSSVEPRMTDLDAVTRDTVSTVERFNAAFNLHDVDAIMALMTEDCIFDDTRPAPDGTEYRGAEAVRARWTAFFERSPHARFETEALIALGEYCVARWTYHWVRDGQAGYVRGVDVLRVREGRVSEKRSYVKG